MKWKFFLTGILIGLIILPTVALGGSFTMSLIQGKSAGEAVQILAEQIDFLISRVEIVETKQLNLEVKQIKVETKQTNQEQTISKLQNIIDRQQKEILCQQLIKETPQIGNAKYMNINIVKFYENDLKNLNECPLISGCAKNLEENQRWLQKSLDRVRPMYDYYLKTCGLPK